jgi:uncharacterized protein YndB with AHSA1/START domain
MRLLKALIISAIVLIAGALVIGFLLPDRAHIERSVVIEAPPETVFGVLNGFARFNEWSPWAELDPNTQYTRGGPETGVGARQAWRSEDPSVGAGSQEIIESTPHSLIRMKLVFEGFDSDNVASYVLAAEGEKTKLTWSYDSEFKGNLMSRYFGLLLDGMIGPDYERGLTKLKALLEAPPG